MQMNSWRQRITLALVASLLVSPRIALADRVGLKDGRVLEGRFARLPGVAINPLNAPTTTAVPQLPIVMCDNELARIMVPKSQVRPDSVAAEPISLERIKIPQRVAAAGSRIASVGPIIGLEPFDEFGRRTFSMNTTRGRVDVIQGITEVTPVWTKIEALQTGGPERRFIWDMRVATSSIPRDELNRVLHKQIDKNNKEQRLRIVRLYLQSERYQDAEDELKQVIADFPNLSELESEVKALQRLSSNRLLRELEMRRQAGQHRTVYGLLQNFPTQNASDETLVEVRTRLIEYTDAMKKAADLVASINKNLEAIEDPTLRERMKPVCNEITQELYFSNIDRLASYERLASDENLQPSEKVALAVSGWMLGAAGATENPQIATSLHKVRSLVHDYMNETGKIRRETILQQIQSEEAYRSEIVASMISRMKPPLDTEPQPNGSYLIQTQGVEAEPDLIYHVQLPPEYDPYMVYPAIVTLNGAGTTPEQQVDWWAGALTDDGRRLGQASRQGYVVIAPVWTKPHQTRANHSPAEHAVVLNSLRDACRRFSIDTDRVFLSGHSMGGDAAWEIGLSHPDLWAGVIPIVARSESIVAFYTKNAKNLPMYFLGGELDGDKLVANSRDLDRYMKAGHDVTLVEYLGRGHEHFSDDILNIFDWMGRKKRNFFPKEFSAVSMRPWDNFFWWLEIREHPPKAVTVAWPPATGVRPMQMEATVNAVGGINVRAGSARVAVWLSPELVDFSRPFSVTINGRKVASDKESLSLDVAVLLEDVRTRGDRQHPFWAKLE